MVFYLAICCVRFAGYICGKVNGCHPFLYGGFRELRSSLSTRSWEILSARKYKVLSVEPFPHSPFGFAACLFNVPPATQASRISVASSSSGLLS